MKPRGYPWPKSQKLYHATIARTPILDDGFKTRSQLSADRHATGGGTDSAISFTTDMRVARAIVLGLRVARLIARGEMQLGEMIIQGAELAPKANAEALREQQLSSPEFVVNIDNGLWPFMWGGGFAERAEPLSRADFDALMATGKAEQIEESRTRPDSDPYRVRGWAPRELLNKDGSYYGHRFHWSYYKALLSQGDMITSELYDPLFFGTNVESLADVDEDDICVLSATVDADWVCASSRDASAMGFEVHSGAAYGWSESCSNYLDMRARGSGHSGFGGYLPTGWDPPDPRDTIAYLGPAMAEIRVYDPSIITDIRDAEGMEESLYLTHREWDDLGKFVEKPIAHPFFKPRTPWLYR